MRKVLTEVSPQAIKWQMKFFVDECKVMLRRLNNSRIIYETIGLQLTVIAQKEDLEVTII